MEKINMKQGLRTTAKFMTRIGTSLAVGTAVAVYVPTEGGCVKKNFLNVAKFCTATAISYKLTGVAVEGMDEWFDDVETLVDMVKTKIAEAKEESD